jgi:hypothetical protein
VINEMLQTDPEKRPTAEKLLKESNWFKALRYKQNNLTGDDADHKIMYLFSLHFIIVSYSIGLNEYS